MLDRADHAAGAINGGNGGDTSVGTLCIAKGGSGGPGSSSAPTQGGAGGVAGTGDVTSTGMPGLGQGVFNNVAANNPAVGGSSSVGGGGNSSGANATGAARTGRASGGQGATSFNNDGAFGGGAGTAGYVVITEFCNQ
jgi:hypothetical protein